MNMSQTNIYLDELNDLISNGKRIPLSNSVVIDREHCFKLVQDIRESLPVDITAAQGVIENQNAIITEARKMAEQAKSEANGAATATVNDANVKAQNTLNAAQAQAQEMLKRAQDQARQMMADAKQKCRSYDGRCRCPGQADDQRTGNRRPCAPGSRRPETVYTG